MNRFSHQVGNWLSSNIYRIGTAFLCLLLFFSPSFEGTLSSVFLLGTLILGGLSWIVMKERTLIINRRLIGLVGLMIVGSFLSTVWSQNKAASWNALTNELGLIILFLIAWFSARYYQWVFPALKGLVLIGGLLACYGIIQSILGLEDSYHLMKQSALLGHQPITGPVAERLLSNRAFSLFAYPNLFAGFIALLFPLNMALLKMVKKPGERMLYIFNSLALTVGLVASQSIGGFLALCCGLVVFVLLPVITRSDYKKTVWFLWMVLIGLGGGLVLFLILQERDLSVVSFSFQQRMANWKNVIDMIQDYWLLGVGPGAFGKLYERYYAAGGHYIRYAHNVFLQIGAEKGLLGITLFLLFIITYTQICWKQMKQLLSTPKRKLVFGLIAGLAAVFVHSLLDIDFSYLKTSMLIWFLAGTLLGLLHPASGQSEPAAGFLPRISQRSIGTLISGLLAFLVLLLHWKGGKSLVSLALFYSGLVFLLGLIVLVQSKAKFLWEHLRTNAGILYLVMLLIGLGAIGALFSSYAAASLPGLCLALTGSAVLVIILIVPKSENRIFSTLALSSTVMGAIVLVQWVQQMGSRTSGGWPNPNLMAAFLAAGLVINCIPLFLRSRNKWHFRQSLISSVVLFAALLATGSMGGFINGGLALVGVSLWLIRKNNRSSWMALLLLSCLATLVLILPFKTGERFKQFSQYHNQLYERVHIARSTLHMIVDHSLMGVGIGQFEKAFDAYRFKNIRGLAQYGKSARFAHNEILQLTAVLGLPGLVLLLLIFYAIYKRVIVIWKNWKRLSITIQVNSLTAGGVLLGAGAQGLVDFNWHLPCLFILYMICLGCLLKNGNLGESEPVISNQTLELKWPRLIVMGCLVLLTLATFLRPVLGSYYLQLGKDHYYKKHLKQAAYYLEQSLSIHPLSAEAYDYLGLVRQDIYAIYRLPTWFELARWAFQKADKLNKNDAYINRHEGNLYRLQATLDGDNHELFMEKARISLHKAVALSPKNAVLLFELGNLYRDSRNYRKAAEYWQKAIQLEPYYAAAASNLGNVLDMMEKPAEAEEAFKKALEIKGLSSKATGKYEIELVALNWAVVHYNLGNLLERQGRWSEAKAEYAKMLAIEPGNRLAIERYRELEKIKQ